MDERTLKKLLRAAVIGALPAAAVLAMACDPCKGAPIRTEKKDSITAPLQAGDNAPLSMEDCIARCKALLQEKQQRDENYGTIEDFSATKCETLQPAGETPKVDCEASFTLVRETYTGASGCPVPGRMPAGQLVVSGEDTHDDVGLYFAQMASMEEAAVTAFRYLLKELEAYDAPEELCQVAREAIDEEIQHAELAGMLAEAYGAKPWKIEPTPFALRPLAAIAEENAAEGCVRETFSAACAMWQAEHAEEDAVRAVMARIVYEESRHAALSWAIDAWAMPQLSPEEQARCRLARADAIDSFEENFATPASDAVRRAAGLPNAEEAAKLFQFLRKELWV